MASREMAAERVDGLVQKTSRRTADRNCESEIQSGWASLDREQDVRSGLVVA
jgi:hypothetical protein